MARERGGEEHILGAYIAITLPGGGRQAVASGALAEAGVATSREAAATQKISAEAAALYHSAIGAMTTWQATHSAAERLQRAADMTARAYQLGEGSLNDLLTARRLANEAQLAARLARLQDHPEGARHDAGRSRNPPRRAGRAGNARHPAPAPAAFDVQIRADRHHHRFRGRHRHLLGAPAGRRTPGRRDGQPAARRHRRHGADHDAARRNVHVHHRGRPAAGRKTRPARLGDPPAAAHHSRRCRRQQPGRRGAHLRGRAATAKPGRARAGAEGLAGGAGNQQPQRRRRPPERRRGSRCWCAPKGRFARSTT